MNSNEPAGQFYLFLVPGDCNHKVVESPEENVHGIGEEDIRSECGQQEHASLDHGATGQDPHVETLHVVLVQKASQQRG